MFAVIEALGVLVVLISVMVIADVVWDVVNGGK